MVIKKKGQLAEGYRIERWILPTRELEAAKNWFPTAEKVIRVQISGRSHVPTANRAYAGISDAGHPENMKRSTERVEGWIETWVVIDEGFGPLRILHCVVLEQPTETNEHLDEYLAPRQLLDALQAAKWNDYSDVRATMLLDLVAVTEVYSSPHTYARDYEQVDSKIEASRWRTFSERAADEAVTRLDTLARLTHPALQAGAKLATGQTRGAVASIGATRTGGAATKNAAGVLIVRLAYNAEHACGPIRYVVQLNPLLALASTDLATTLENAYGALLEQRHRREKLVSAAWLIDAGIRINDALVAAEPGVTLSGFYRQMTRRPMLRDLRWSALLSPDPKAALLIGDAPF